MTDDDKPTAAARGRVLKRPPPARPAPPPKPRGLRIHRADAPPVDVALDDEARTVIGRHDAADVAFDAAEVSRLHGALSCDHDRWLYQDLGSSNGSALERAGARIALRALEKTALEVGDVVIVGDSACRLELLAAPPVSPAAAPADGSASHGASNGAPHSASNSSPGRGDGDRAGGATSPAARALEQAIAVAARTPLPVFLLGPSGAGKTHAARAVHDRSGARGAFVAVNCARLPVDPVALQSELLGHVKGAFTGAQADRLGKLQAADGGTLFLDEVESLPEVAQGFLLDVLEGTGQAPLGAQGSRAPGPVRFRLISASKRALSQSGLRNDLCERLAEGHMIKLPTLDDRRQDIPALVHAFADEQGRMLGVDVDVAPEAMDVLSEASWPGQLRQLRAAVSTCAHVALAKLPEGTRAVTVSKDDVERHLGERAAAFAAPEPAPAAAVKPNPRYLTAVDVRGALDRHGGNQSAAARELGIARNTLLKKMKDFGIGTDP